MIRLQSRFCFKSEYVFPGHIYWVNKVYFLHEYLFSLLPAEISFSTSTSHITHQTSDIKHRTSNIRHPTPDIKHQTSVTPHRTSNIRHPTPNIRHPTFYVTPTSSLPGPKELVSPGQYSNCRLGKELQHEDQKWHLPRLV
jgi:hypothetical protein